MRNERISVAEINTLTQQTHLVKLCTIHWTITARNCPLCPKVRRILVACTPLISFPFLEKDGRCELIDQTRWMHWWSHWLMDCTSILNTPAGTNYNKLGEGSYARMSAERKRKAAEPQERREKWEAAYSYKTKYDCQGYAISNRGPMHYL